LNFDVGIGGYTPSPPACLFFGVRVDISGKNRDFYVKSASFSVVNVTEQTTSEVQQVLTDFKNLSLVGTGTNYVGFVGVGNSQSAYFFAAIN
jgi:hypothetical protein